MNYIGSKLKLSSFIKDTVCSIAGKDLSRKVFCDLFAGTGIVGRTFKKDVKKVISNDFEYYSYVLNKNYIGNNKPLKFQKYLAALNNIKPANGFIYKNYCPGSGSGRQYFSDENGKKIDAARRQIEKWGGNKEISRNLYFFLLASLLEAADKAANTASVYGAFLKKLKPSARKNLFLEPALFAAGRNANEVYNEDANTLIKRISGDILYLDPPYNERQYGANYHLLNTIAEYKNFKPKGKTGLRDYTRSNYCVKKQVASSFENLIAAAKFKYIFLSYNNEGLMGGNEIKKIMSKYGRYKVVRRRYQRFKADKTGSRNHKTEPVFEYLHILTKF